MKNNTLSNKRLIQYAASAAAFLAVNSAQATVAYTDLDPDLAIGGEGGEITIDVNSDGTDDLGFFVYSILGTALTMVSILPTMFALQACQHLMATKF